MGITRWTYSTTLSNYTLPDYKILKVLGSEENFKTNAYIRFKIFRVSKFKRRINMRRKHFTNWIPYLNILGDWATEYRFFARYVKLLLNINILKFSYVSLNVLRIGSYSREFVNLFSKFKGASHLNVFNSYFRSFTSNKLNTSFFKNAALLNVSSLSITPTSTDTNPSILYLQSQNTLYAPNSASSQLTNLNFIQTLGCLYALTYSKELYKILILLSLKAVYK